MFYEDSKSKCLSHVSAAANVNIEIGIGLILIGIIFFILGIFFFLDRALIVIGNVRTFLSHDL